MNGSLPGGMTLSITSSLPFGGMAARQLRRIVSDFSSSQSWMMCRIR